MAPQPVSDALDEVTRQRLKQIELQLSLETTQLMEQLEQTHQGQYGFAWGAMLLHGLQHWQFWVAATVLVLLLGLLWWLRKRSREPDHSSGEESSSSNNEQAKVENEGYDFVGFLDKHIQWQVQNLASQSEMAKKLMDRFVLISQKILAESFSLVLQPAIGVGSSFEGWNPCEKDITHRMLVPLKAPQGYSFHLEPDTAQELPGRGFRIRVQPECTCSGEEPTGDVLCFLHHPEQEWRSDEVTNFFDHLCTDHYLDVEKTACWFCHLMVSAWSFFLLSRSQPLVMLPSRRSCKFEVRNCRQKILTFELIFGVQQGDSDIFVTSETSPDAVFTPSTMWFESCAVAEVKFFRYVAWKPGSYHLHCLHLCTRILLGYSFSTYIMKTVVMHLMASTPQSGWRRRHFLMRLGEIMRYLGHCVEERCLNHFFFGNENVPEEIVLPPGFREAEPLNLFQHLVEDTAAHAKALRDFDKLKDKLARLLIYGKR
ncbi:inositol 1,4,5-trisphosphate receptor-interacting protein-like 1 [Colius striatus]|uniref:inositol 1,4,5-trisphosphate receptor-interacting protein-like 1 n=1 Tax=Colius striatus TaxID=57412 RepID=UPI002B1E0D3F|nr:inositol 1,4,5-trisphosphate receptor-interacting protein-like 1 [Colius striatus]